MPWARRTVALEDGRLRSYEGGWAEYLRAREERREASRGRRRGGEAGAPRREGGSGARKAASGGAGEDRPSKNARRRVAELEREVERAEAALRKLEDELADPAQVEHPDAHRRVGRAPRAAKRAVEEAYARWEEASPTRRVIDQPRSLRPPASFFWTLPMALRGRLSTNRTSRGRLCGRQLAGHVVDQLAGGGPVAAVAGHDESDDPLTQVGSAAPTTAASSTAGWPSSAISTSPAPTL